MDALKAFENANPSVNATTLEEAIKLVQLYAQMCTYSGISGYAKEALLKTKPKEDDEPLKLQ